MLVRLFPLVLVLGLASGCGDGLDVPKRGLGVQVCGDGRLAPGEACDDGNTRTETCRWNEASCTVCSATCELVPGETSRCGDERIDPLHEGCDDGNAVTESCAYGERCSVCDATCQLVEVARRCGDGAVDADAGEACDEGEANDDTTPDACRLDCQLPRCGDGVIDGDEACEPPGAGACRADCSLPACGDGILDPGEACEPQLDAACRADCTLPLCGDGRIDPGESCDDGAFAVAGVALAEAGGCFLAEGGEVRCVGEALAAVPAEASAGAVRLAAGPSAACAIDGEGAARCWGDDPAGVGLLAPPEGVWGEIALGPGHGCGLRPNGFLVCWGQITELPTARYGWSHLASGHGFSCGISPAGHAFCWGASTFGVLDAPDGTFAEIAAGTHHACALGADDGRAVCWGDGSNGQLAAPELRLHALAAAGDLACALDDDGRPHCWGDLAPWIPAPAGPFERLEVAPGRICGIGAGGAICWGGEPLDAAGIGNTDGLAGTCRSDCSLPRCGDGVIDPAEACDDGNSVDDGNGCSAICTRLGSCGDGVLQPGFEACDDGPADPNCGYGQSCLVCGATCRLVEGLASRCGDGLVDAGAGESCDDGLRSGAFRVVSTAGPHACGILEDGRLRCWGDGALAGVPTGSFAEIELGSDFGCALDEAGAIRCWGAVPAPPEGSFHGLAAGPAAACALDGEGTLHCWGTIDPPPAGGGWTAVAVGDESACALDAAGAIACWGAGARDLEPPAGTFVAVAVGDTLRCAIDGEGMLSCWGQEAAGYTLGFPVVALSAWGDTVCVLDRSGSATCLGPWAPQTADGVYRAVDAGAGGSCALGIDGMVSCWGSAAAVSPTNSDVLPDACRTDCQPASCGDGVWDSGEGCDDGNTITERCPYGRVSACTVCDETCESIAGERAYCGDGIVQQDHESCDDGASSIAEIRWGDAFACVRAPRGALDCWGENGAGQATPPAGQFQLLAVGQRHACATQPTGVSCWGAGDLGQTTAPSGTFVELVAGSDFTCGRPTNGTGISCWGDVPFVPPSLGTWRGLAAGDRHLCAIGAADEVSCWGENGAGQASPPSGTLASHLAAGRSHACASHPFSGLPVCWGDDAAGQATPPAQFIQEIYAGGDLTCALGLNDDVVCWGAAPAGAAGPNQLRFSALALPRWGAGAICGQAYYPHFGLICWAGGTDPLVAPLETGNSDVRPDSCRTNCQPARCGDGTVDTGEACDDGNTTSGDGCSASCAAE